MKSTSMALALCALLVAGACAKNQPGATAGASGNEPAAASQQQANLTPEQLGALGAEIKKNPSDAHRLLGQHNLDEQKFEQEIRKVSEDPAAAKRYRDAYQKAGA